MIEFDVQLTQMVDMLTHLDNWLEKGAQHAQAKGFEPKVLLQSRLSPDMFTLSRQIQSACDGVKFLAARVAGKDAPKHADGDDFTLDELRARIRSVIEYASGFGPKDFAGAEQRIVPLGFMPGKGLRAQDYALQMTIPNTYFHLCMAYAILRHNGVGIGKMDYLGNARFVDLQ